MVTSIWKIYGTDCMHRPHPSEVYDYGDNLITEIYNSNLTGTYEYSIVRVTHYSYEECEEELEFQISDGVFKNWIIKDKVEITEGEFASYNFDYIKVFEEWIWWNKRYILYPRDEEKNINVSKDLETMILMNNGSTKLSALDLLKNGTHVFREESPEATLEYLNEGLDEEDKSTLEELMNNRITDVKRVEFEGITYIIVYVL